MKSGRKKRATTDIRAIMLRILKSSLFGCVITVVIILFFALLLKWELLPESCIPVATSVMKALCAAFVGFLCANGLTKGIWLWAGSGGAVYVLLAFLAFSLVEKSFGISLSLLADLGMGFVAGIAGGMLPQLKWEKKQAKS